MLPCPICMPLIDSLSSLTESNPNNPQGDSGGDSLGEYRIEVGEDPNEAFRTNESQPSRLGKLGVNSDPVKNESNPHRPGDSESIPS